MEYVTKSTCVSIKLNSELPCPMCYAFVIFYQEQTLNTQHGKKIKAAQMWCLGKFVNDLMDGKDFKRQMFWNAQEW